MTDSKDIKPAGATGGGEARTFGKRADPDVKATRPQVGDADKLRVAISDISDLDARLAKLNDAASGPFGSDEVDFASGKVDALLEDAPQADKVTDDTVTDDGEDAGIDLSSMLEDTPAPEAAGTPDEASEAAEDDADIPLDELLGNDLEEDQASADDGEADIEVAIPDLVSEDAIEATPISASEAEAQDDAEYNASMDAFLAEMGEDGLFEIDDDPHDPVDDLVEEGLSRSAEHPDNGQSPFAALFSPVQAMDDEIHDAGLPDDLDDEDPEPVAEAAEPSVDIEDDADLFFDDIYPDDDMASDEVIETLPGAKGFEGDDQDEWDPLSDADDGMLGDAPGSGLPELTMGGDDGIYAPGTDYADEEPAHRSDEDMSDDPHADEADASKIEHHIEKDDEMAISVNGSDAADKTPETREDDLGIEENTFETEGLDELLAEDDEAVTPADFGEAAEDDAPAVADDSDVDAIFGDEAEEVAGSEDPVVADLARETIEDTPELAEAEQAEHLDDAEEAPAKKGKAKALLLTAASVVVLGGGLGFAAFNNMIPGVSFGDTPPAQPIVVADADDAPVFEPIDDIPTVSMDELGAETASEDVAEPGTIRLSDLIQTTEEAAQEAANEVAEPIEDLQNELAGLLDQGEDATPDTIAIEMPEEITPEDIVIGETDPTVPDFPAMPDVADAPIEAPEMPLGEAEPEVVTEGDVDADAPLAEGDDTPIADVAEVFDPISELAAQIQGNKTDEDEQAATEGEESTTGSLFVEESRVIEIEDDVTTLGLRLDDLTSEISQMNDLIMQSMERNSVISERVESNERSLRGVTAILAEFAKVQDSLDQTQIVLLDIAARVGSLEASNPADRDEVAEALREIDGEMKRLTANMAILARMTVNGVSAMQAEGASAGNHAVQTTQSQMPALGNDTVYADDSEGFEAVSTPPNAVPADVSEGDFVEGYGYVLDVVPASGNQNLVVMENGSVLVPK